MHNRIGYATRNQGLATGEGITPGGEKPNRRWHVGDTKIQGRAA